MICNDHVHINVWYLHVTAPWQAQHRPQGRRTDFVSISLFLRFSGEFNFLVTQQTSHVYSGQSFVTAGQQQQRQSRNVSEGGLLQALILTEEVEMGALPFHSDGCCWYRDIGNLDKWGRDRTETGRGVGMIFVCGARRARSLACCIPWDKHHGVCFHPPNRRETWPAYLLSPTAPVSWLFSFFLSRDHHQCHFTIVPLLWFHALMWNLSTAMPAKYFKLMNSQNLYTVCLSTVFKCLPYKNNLYCYCCAGKAQCKS